MPVLNHSQRLQLVPGDRIRLREDDGRITDHTVESEPWKLGGHTWVILLSGKRGGYALDRVVELVDTAPIIHQSCSWCHAINDITAAKAKRPQPVHCGECGHRADLPRVNCDCDLCSEPPPPLDQSDLDTMMAWLGRRGGGL